MTSLADRLRRLVGIGGAQETEPFAFKPEDICGIDPENYLDSSRRSDTRNTRHSDHLPMLGPDVTPFQKQMNKDMAKMMQDMHAPGYSDDVNVDFLAMMIPHHQGAIDMAKLQLVHGDDPLTRRLAEEIIDGQQVEIQAMLARLKILREGPDKSLSDFPALDGTRKS